MTEEVTPVALYIEQLNHEQNDLIFSEKLIFIIDFLK